MRYVSKFKVNGFEQVPEIVALVNHRNADKLFHFEPGDVVASTGSSGPRCDDGTIDIAVYFEESKPPMRCVGDDGTIHELRVSVPPPVPMSHLIPVEPDLACDLCGDVACSFSVAAGFESQTLCRCANCPMPTAQPAAPITAPAVE